MRDPVASVLGRVWGVRDPDAPAWRLLLSDAASEVDAWWFRRTKCRASRGSVFVCSRWRWHRGHRAAHFVQH